MYIYVASNGINSLAIVQDLNTLQLEQCPFWHYADDIMLRGSSEEVVQASLYTYHLYQHGQAITLHKFQGPASSVKFLGIIWPSKG